MTTHLRRAADGRVLARAGWIAAIPWVVGVGARMGFAWASTQGAGPAIERFSIAHSITSVNAWVAALFLMAIAEVVLRLAVMGLRANRLRANRLRATTVVAPASVSVGV